MLGDHDVLKHIIQVLGDWRARASLFDLEDLVATASQGETRSQIVHRSNMNRVDRAFYTIWMQCDKTYPLRKAPNGEDVQGSGFSPHLASGSFRAQRGLNYVASRLETSNLRVVPYIFLLNTLLTTRTLICLGIALACFVVRA